MATRMPDNANNGTSAQQRGSVNGKPKPRDSRLELVTPKQLEALKRSNYGPQKKTISRLIATLEAAWMEYAALEAEIERTEPTDDERKELEQPGRVVVSLDFRGRLDVYATKAVLVKVVEVKPWEDTEERVARVCKVWFGDFWQDRLKVSGGLSVCRSVDEALAWYERARTWETWKAIEASGKVPEIVKRLNSGETVAQVVEWLSTGGAVR